MLALDAVPLARARASNTGCCPGCTDSECDGSRCHDRFKLSAATFRRDCKNVSENEVGLWGDCPVCRSTLLYRDKPVHEESLP